MTEIEKQVNILFKDFLLFILKTILLDIAEGDVNSFALDNKTLLDQSKDYCWPMDYEHIEELINYIEGNNDHYYKL
ncbi:MULTISPECIES: hypothetical protein [Priestia]|uniref:hypothetical protein n=1 Tax=Priestia TaxID=2800373 RepID=UPI001C8D5E47|nr:MULTISPECIES: hypothetical protein [Priestia]MBX9988034.1 hypothetical protein [Priestia aryabhattai]MBY0001414.1 hypothetical protein [Priestia aryabhattai]MCZ8496750.1 hypothetical protein [Priestia megaterium]UYV50722.1 hypothetical protein OHU65_14055 [Priestia megaterium]